MSTGGHGRRMDVQRAFPKTRKEAEKVAAVIKEQAKIAGCTCKDITIEFVDPPLMRPYVQVGHRPLCPLAEEKAQL